MVISSSTLADVTVERRSQDQQWGGPTHDDEHEHVDWCDFIVRQVKRLRAGTVLLEGGHLSALEDAEVLENNRRHLVKIAALALAAIDSHDRIYSNRPDAEQEHMQDD